MRLGKLSITALLAAMSFNMFAATSMNDAQITQVVLTVDRGEADLGKIAKSKTKNDKVKGFAEMMVKEHTEGQKKMTDFTMKSSLMPADSEKSKMMKTESELTKTKLMAMNDKAFDKAYIDSQVAAHQKVLDGIDKKLLPQAKNNELKAMLQKKRETVKAHLGHAKEIQSSMM